jgi:hypothetical protein
MKRLLWPLAVVIVPAILGAAGFLVARSAPSAPAAPPDTTATLRPTASPTPAPTSAASGRPQATPTARPRRHHAGPWAVVSAYYRDVSSRKYAKAWALISPDVVAGQTYQQFVAGYACTGTERPTRLSLSGHQVGFNLTVVNTCTAAFQYYTGTDTVRGGKIVAADVTRTG